MHPSPNSSRRSRHSSFTDNEPTPLASSRQRSDGMTFFLTDEKTMESSTSRSHYSPNRPKLPPKRNFGVESLETTISSLTADDDTALRRESWTGNMTRSPSPKSRDISPTHVKPDTRPVTPYSPMLSSTPGSPMSRRGSESGFLTDDATSQAVFSGGEEDEDVPQEASQLVMPSLSLPSRRPFTEKGKNLGQLKILIAGDSGIGKTSLIKAIFQVCEDIVHVDELSSPQLSVSHTKKAKRAATPQITEVYASTRAYPVWWSELDDGKVLRRRKSMGDSVLERNLCFVDTPGYGNGTSFIESIGPVVQYLEKHLERSSSLNLTDSELIRLMSGAGGSQVDVVFYMIEKRVKPADIEYLQRLAPLANIIPIIAKADASTPEHLQSLKANTLSQLGEAKIKPFLFGAATPTTLEPGSNLPPWTISNLTGNDPENIDASLLMSPDYISPLQPSQLTDLVSRVFDRDSISWLRHSTAKKYIQHRTTSASSRSQSLPTSLLPSTTTSTFSLLPSQVLTPPLGATSSYSLARITDHTKREEQLAQVRLSKWAADLQRSLHNERLRFEALARGERAVWLTERLSECVQDGTLVPVSHNRLATFSTSSSGDIQSQVLPGGVGMSMSPKSTYKRKVKEPRAGLAGCDRTDPLGLVKLNEEMARRSWAALQIVGSFGIIGALGWWWSRGGWTTGGLGAGAAGETGVGGAGGPVGGGAGGWEFLGFATRDW